MSSIWSETTVDREPLKVRGQVCGDVSADLLTQSRGVHGGELDDLGLEELTHARGDQRVKEVHAHVAHQPLHCLRADLPVERDVEEDVLRLQRGRRHRAQPLGSVAELGALHLDVNPPQVAPRCDELRSLAYLADDLAELRDDPDLARRDRVVRPKECQPDARQHEHDDDAGDRRARQISRRHHLLAEGRPHRQPEHADERRQDDDHGDAREDRYPQNPDHQLPPCRSGLTGVAFESCRNPWNSNYQRRMS